MKTRIISLSTILLAMFMTAPAWALYIDQDGNGVAETDVGNVDVIEGQTTSLTGIGFGGTDCSTLNGSKPAAEECWAEGVLDGTGLVTDLTLATGSSSPADVQYYNTYTDTASPTSTSNPNVIAFALTQGPGYYILKDANSWVLLSNVADIDWGVVDLDQITVKIGVEFNCETGCTVSHVTEFDGSKVAEPGSLALLGAGLLAFGAIRRRKFRI